MADLAGITRLRHRENWAPSMHECLKRLEVRNLLLVKG